MSQRSKLSPYTGKLNEPIKWTGPLLPPKRLTELFETDADFKKRELQFQNEFHEARRLVIREQVNRIELLFKHYKLDNAKSGWSEPMLATLVIRLAEDWVPGFKVDYDLVPQRRSGRKTKWDLFASLQLMQDVKKIKNNKKDCSDREACRIIIRNSERKKATSILYQNKSSRGIEISRRVASKRAQNYLKIN